MTGFRLPFHKLLRVLRVGGAVCALALLAGCSVLTLAYNRVPMLAYWRLDAMLNLESAQATQVRAGLEQWHRWHRQQHLPAYRVTLQRWQALALQDLTATQACQEFAVLRGWAQEAAEEAVPLLAQLARTLTPAQLAHWQRHQAEQAQEFRADFSVPAVASGNGAEPPVSPTRYKRALDRAEMLYGRLSDEQRRWLRERLARSLFDAPTTLAERERRFVGMQDTVRRVQAGADAEPAVRAVLAEIFSPTSPAYAAYTQRLVADGCAQMAELHNLTTPEQRRRAVQKLEGFAADFAVLANGRP
jgi:hypothetical protein